MVGKTFFSCFMYQSRHSFFSLSSIFLFFMATHWKQRQLLCTTSRTCEVFSAIAETISLLSSYPHSYTMSHQALLEISIIFSSICNPFSSCTNFFAFSTTIFMFSVQSSLGFLRVLKNFACTREIWRPVQPFPIILLANISPQLIWYTCPCFGEVYQPLLSECKRQLGCLSFRKRLVVGAACGGIFLPFLFLRHITYRYKSFSNILKDYLDGLPIVFRQEFVPGMSFSI